MKVKYKDIKIRLSSTDLLYIEYLDNSDSFYIYYTKKGLTYAPLSTNVNKLPQIIKDTMNYLIKQFYDFYTGSESINEFLLFLQSKEREKKLNELGI